MKTVFVTIMASLVVVLALFVLISEDPSRLGDGGLTIHGERVSSLGHGCLETVLLQHKQSESTTSNSMIVKAQRALRDDGFLFRASRRHDEREYPRGVTIISAIEANQCDGGNGQRNFSRVGASRR